MRRFNMKTEIYCTLQVEGTHNWPDCPFEEVAYLRDPHRHMFGVKAYVEVKHDDRDVEFIRLKHRIESYLLTTYGQPILEPLGWEICDNKRICIFGATSCEMLAKELIKQFNLSRCEVDEDGENGAIVNAMIDTLETIEIDITEEQEEVIIKTHVNQLSEASRGYYNTLRATMTREQALHAVILNEGIIIALRRKIVEDESKRETE